MTDERLKNLEQAIDRQGQKIDKLTETIQKIAVQDSRIEGLQQDINEMFPRIRVCELFQASCPRTESKIELMKVHKRINWIWLGFIPSTIALLSASYALIKIGIGQ